MNKMQEQVAEFHKAFAVPVNETPCTIDRDRAYLRAKLIFEEAQETINALHCYLYGTNGDAEKIKLDQLGFIEGEDEPMSLVEVADGLADLLYVTFGACLEFGIDIQAVFDEVHRSNMSKAWDEFSVKCLKKDFGGTVTAIGNGKYAVKRADGKILKSPDYDPADIQSVLEKLKGK